MASPMDQFLTRFGIQHLKERLRIEGVVDPNAFKHLLKEDITNFIHRQDRARPSQKALKLGEIAKLRTAWNEVKNNGGWNATKTASATKSEDTEIQQLTTTIQPNMLGCSLCPSQLGTLGGPLDLAHKCSSTVPQLGERRKDPSFKLSMKCPFIGCKTTISVFRQCGTKFEDLWKHVSRMHVLGTEETKARNQFKELFGIFFRLQGIVYKPKTTTSKQKGSDRSRNCEDVERHPEVVPAVPQAGQSSDGPEMPPSCCPPGYDWKVDLQELQSARVNGIDEAALGDSLLSPVAYREQKSQRNSARPILNSDITERHLPTARLLHNKHRQRSVLSRRRQLLRWAPIRRLPLYRILRKDKNGKRVTWLIHRRFGSRIFEIRKRTLSSRSSSHTDPDKGDKKKKKKRE